MLSFLVACALSFALSEEPFYGEPILLDNGTFCSDINLTYFPIEDLNDTAIKFNTKVIDTFIVYYTNTYGVVFSKTTTKTLDPKYNFYTYIHSIIVNSTETYNGWVMKTKTTMVVPTFKDDYVKMGIVAGVSILICIIIFSFGFLQCCFIDSIEENHEQPMYATQQAEEELAQIEPQYIPNQPVNVTISMPGAPPQPAAVAPNPYEQPVVQPQQPVVQPQQPAPQPQNYVDEKPPLPDEQQNPYDINNSSSGNEWD